MASTENDYALVIDGTIMFGFGGTKCIQFVLQVMGMDVCGISTDTISNHFAHKQYALLKESADDIEKTYAALKANDLHKRFTHIFTGVARSMDISSKLAEIVKDIKTCNPEAIYLCDPVLGDNEDYYSLFGHNEQGALMDVLLSYADITTPNQFEAECISGIKIHSQDDALTAIQRIHEKGPNIVIITSFVTEDKNMMTTIGSRWKNGEQETYRIDYPNLDVYMIGTGDLLASSFLGLLRKTDDFKTSLEKAISIAQIVCRRTVRETKESIGPGVELESKMLELRVAQCAPFILSPQVIYPSKKLL